MNTQYNLHYTPPLHRVWELEKVVEKLKAENDRLRAIESALANSGLDVSPCTGCGDPVVCIPDGLSSLCVKCHAAKEKT